MRADTKLSKLRRVKKLMVKKKEARYIVRRPSL